MDRITSTVERPLSLTVISPTSMLVIRVRELRSRATDPAAIICPSTRVSQSNWKLSVAVSLGSHSMPLTETKTGLSLKRVLMPGIVVSLSISSISPALFRYDGR